MSMASSSVKSKIARLRTTFLDGRTRQYTWRCTQLRALLRFIQEQEEAIIDALHQDLGRCRFDSYAAEMQACRAEIELILSSLHNWMKPTYTKLPALMQPATSEYQYQPLGVTLVIGPYNYPFMLSVSPIAGAFAAGCPVLLKPSEMTAAMEKLLSEQLPRYLDPDAFCVETGGREVVTALLAERWDKIFFTGSPRVGKIVLKAAAEFMTPVTLELGGKSPVVVDESCAADLEVVTQRLVWGKMMNAGQTCIAPDYVFVHEKHYERFLSKASEMLTKFYGQGEAIKQSDLARGVSEAHCERLKGLLEECVGKGARVVHGGKLVDIKAKFVEPTVLADVPLDSQILQDEIFGPLLPVLKFSKLDEVRDFIRAREHPLALYIFSKNRKRIDFLTESIQCGAVVVNDALFHSANPHLPFGGIGNSGMGYYHGIHSMECFSHKRACLRRDDTWALDLSARFPPYNDTKLWILLTALRLPDLPIITKRGFQVSLVALAAASIASIAAVALHFGAIDK